MFVGTRRNGNQINEIFAFPQRITGLARLKIYDFAGPFLFMKAKKVIRCQGDVHKAHQGNILVAISENALYVKCQDRGCKRWTRITINIPGIKINLLDAGIIQDAMPEEYHLTLEPATVVVGSK